MSLDVGISRCPMCLCVDMLLDSQVLNLVSVVEALSERVTRRPTATIIYSCQASQLPSLSRTDLVDLWHDVLRDDPIAQSCVRHVLDTRSSSRHCTQYALYS